MSKQAIGTCSLCGGPVMVPSVWLCVVPPVPTCARCGATAKQAFGKTIEMEPQADAMIAEKTEAGKETR